MSLEDSYWLDDNEYRIDFLLWQESENIEMSLEKG